MSEPCEAQFHGVVCADRALTQAGAEHEKCPWWRQSDRRRWRRACATAAAVVVRQTARRKALRLVRERFRQEAGPAF